MTQSLWSGFAMATPLGARIDGRVPEAVTGVSIDTRTLQPGDCFVAIKGDNSDGHDYVALAFEKGAAVAVVDEANAARLKGLGTLFVVADTLRSMENLGRAARARVAAHIIAVTGSVGKTGTKEALRLALSNFGPTHASAASYNNHWGVPLTLARMPRETRFGVFEIGMNHAGEITALVDMVRPHVAIITTIAPVHLEFFESIDAIAEAKAEIFTGLEPGGVAIINRDVAQYELLRSRAASSAAGAVLSFGEHDEADACLLRFAAEGAGSRVLARISGREIDYHLAAAGRHMALNSLATLLAAEAVGADLEGVARALGAFDAPVGRGQRLTLPTRGGDFTLIDESYNANPASMRAALALLGSAEVRSPGRRVAAIGDMLELGPDSAALHRDLADEFAANHVDAVYASGPMSRELYETLPTFMRGAWAETSAGIEKPLLDSIAAGDVIMVKGSNGSRMGPIVASIKKNSAERAGRED